VVEETDGETAAEEEEEEEVVVVETSIDDEKASVDALPGSACLSSKPAPPVESESTSLRQRSPSSAPELSSSSGLVGRSSSAPVSTGDMALKWAGRGGEKAAGSRVCGLETVSVCMSRERALTSERERACLRMVRGEAMGAVRFTATALPGRTFTLSASLGALGEAAGTSTEPKCRGARVGNSSGSLITDIGGASGTSARVR
jgi:hypothetical protein